MRELDWEYLTEILEAATEGDTGCAPELFDGGKVWYALGEQLPPGWGEEGLRNYLKTRPNTQPVIPAKAGTQAPVSITYQPATPGKSLS